MNRQFDLHSHSTASDGTLEPAELMRRAAAAGVEVMALTDHDTLAGLDEAAATAAGLGLAFVPGVEISVTWRQQTVHIVGLGVDRSHPALVAGLGRLRAYREQRAEAIADALAAAGIADTLEGARAHSSGRLIGRTHFARHLVERGYGTSVGKVFQHFLVRGKPGHVADEWADLSEAVGWITAAGGQAVVAHPARYKLTRTRLIELFEAFRAAGGVAVEVVSGSHTAADYQRMAELTQRLGLLASAGSDYHGPEQAWIALGQLPALPPGCTPVWHDWAVSAAPAVPA